MDNENKRRPKSLKFKLTVYFILFAAIVIGMIWVLQVFFLNNYYENSRISSTTKLANHIAEKYQVSGIDENVLSELEDLANEYDTEILIEQSDNVPIYVTKYNYQQVKLPFYIEQRDMIKQYLTSTGKLSSYTFIKEMEPSGVSASSNVSKTLAYGRYLTNNEDEVSYLFLFTPLYPVSSTITILRNQLIYVTIITLFLALIFAVLVTIRITRPINDMRKSAVRLADGEYGVDFRGRHYSELVDLGYTLNKMSHELQKTEQLRKDLMANVSHDLRTPLTMIKSYAEMIRDLSGDNPEKRGKHLSVIIDETDRLNILVNDVFTLSKMQAGVADLQLRNFNISSAVEELISTYDLKFEQDDYDFHKEIQPDIIINGDESKLQQVIANFMTNAMKYCGEDKYIGVTLRILDAAEGTITTAGNTRVALDTDLSSAGSIAEKKRKSEKAKNSGASKWVFFSVTDHGSGISEDEKDAVWEKYYRASNNYMRTSGTGLGLAIAKESLKAHNAKYGVESTLGEGSTFWFCLPIE